MADSVVGERYQLCDLIGRGAMGSVWRAFDRKLQRHVALKRMNEEHLTLGAARERFQQEAVAIARLKNAHVVQIHDCGLDDGVPYFVMELLTGESLHARFERFARLPPSSLSRLLEQVARALDAAHAAGMVHRDLKPENVFLAHTPGDAETVKVLDFGLAALVASIAEQPDSRPALLGTPPYMSPEQARGSRKIDHRSDLWSLAVLAYRGLTGALPFAAETLGALLVSIGVDDPPPPTSAAHELGLGPEIDDFFKRALAKDPASRFQSGGELAASFSRAVAPAPSTLNVLVAEDEPDAQKLLSQQFRKEIASKRYRFFFAADGRAGLDVLEGNPEIDIALTDIRMPSMDGLTFLARARATRPDLPVIVVSAYSDMANIRTAMNRGAFDFVVKPYDMPDLAATIHKALEHARELRAAAISTAENRALRMFVSHRVGQRITDHIKGVDLPAAEVADATVVFLRLRGFDGPLEDAPPALELRRLNANFEVLIPEIAACGGSIERFLGGGLVALFTGPDHAQRALDACMSVCEQLAWLAAAAEESPHDAGTRAGVATGRILRGCAGSRSFMRLDDALLGSPVSVAKALVQGASPGEVLVAESTMRAVGPLFELRRRDLTTPNSGPAVAWRVLRREPRVRFPGQETMLVETTRNADDDNDGDA